MATWISRSCAPQSEQLAAVLSTEFLIHVPVRIHESTVCVSVGNWHRANPYIRATPRLRDVPHAASRTYSEK